MTLIAIPANDIDIAGQAVDAVLPKVWLEAELADLQATALGPGRFVGRVSRSDGAEIVVHGKVTAKVTLPCARCLDPAQIDVDTELALLLQPGAASPATAPKKEAPKKHIPHRERVAPVKDSEDAGKPQRGGHKKKKEKDVEYEFSAGEADVDTYDGDTVVLDDFVREAILLEMPIFPLCSESCPGIGPGASSEAAVSPPAAPILDPRLAPLAALREKLAAASKSGASAKSTSKKKTKKE